MFTLRGERKVKEIGIGWCNLWIADTEQRRKKEKKTDKAKRGTSRTLTAQRPQVPPHPAPPVGLPVLSPGRETEVGGGVE